MMKSNTSLLIISFLMAIIVGLIMIIILYIPKLDLLSQYDSNKIGKIYVTKTNVVKKKANNNNLYSSFIENKSNLLKNEKNDLVLLDIINDINFCIQDNGMDLKHDEKYLINLPNPLMIGRINEYERLNNKDESIIKKCLLSYKKYLSNLDNDSSFRALRLVCTKNKQISYCKNPLYEDSGITYSDLLRINESLMKKILSFYNKYSIPLLHISKFETKVLNMKFYKEKFQLKRVNHKELPSSVYQDQDVDRLTKDPIGFNNTDAGKCFYNQKEDQWTCLPSMVGLGAMKASTGELRLWIRSHPRMKYSRKMGEVHYYDKRYQTFESFPRIGQKKFDLEAFKSDPAHIEGYLNYFPKIETHKMLENPLFFEKNPGLDIANPLTFRHTLPNNAKYFILLRDPAERLYSGFWWHCNRRFKELECSNEILLDYVKKMEVAKKEIYAATTAENIVKAGVKMFGKKFTVSENKDYQAYMYRFFMREVLQSMYQHLIERYENAYDVNTDYSNDNKRSNNANLIVLYSDTIKLQPEQAMFDVEKVLNIAHYNYSQLVKKTPQGWSTIDIKATKAFEKHHVNYTKLNQQPEIKKRLSDFYADANINLRNKFLKAKEFKNNFLIISEPLPKWLQ